MCVCGCFFGGGGWVGFFFLGGEGQRVKMSLIPVNLEVTPHVVNTVFVCTCTPCTCTKLSELLSL